VRNDNTTYAQKVQALTRAYESPYEALFHEENYEEPEDGRESRSSLISPRSFSQVTQEGAAKSPDLIRLP
jgi:hypothetical protein